MCDFIKLVEYCYRVKLYILCFNSLWLLIRLPFLQYNNFANHNREQQVPKSDVWKWCFAWYTEPHVSIDKFHTLQKYGNFHIE